MQPSFPRAQDDCQVFPYQQLNAPYHLHALFEIIIPHSGYVLARLTGQDRIVHPGEMAIVFPGVAHSFRTECAGEGLVIRFSDSMVSELGENFAQMLPSEPIVPIENADQDVAHCLKRISETLGGRNANSPLIKAYLTLMFLRLKPVLRLEKSASPAAKDLLYQAMQYISQNMTAPLTIRSTARALGVNTHYLSRALNDRLNMSFRAYLNALRIDRAKRYLNITSQPIEEISVSCGFTNLRTFDRVFFERCGCTPRDFRKAAIALRESEMN